MSFRLLLSSLFLAALLSSCEKEIELKTQSNKCIVANALIAENEPIAIRIFNGVDYIGKKRSELLENANLTVYCNGELMEEINGINSDSSYRTSVVPKFGEIYSIKIDCQHYPTATASATVPNPIQIKVLQPDSVQMFVDIDGYKTYESSGEVVLSVTDTTDELRYYLLTVTGYVKYPGNPDTVKYRMTPVYNNLTAQPASLSDIMTHMFESADVEHVKDKEYILFSNQNWQGKSTTLRFGLYNFSEKDADIYVMAFDEEYYKYFISKELQRNEDEESLMFSEPVSIYSNVKNGLGLFAGYSMATTKLCSVRDTIYEY